MHIDRLFLPLNKMWYDLFVSGQKTWELRGINSQYNEKTVYLGRAVEIRSGYKNGAKFGKIDAYIIAKSWDDLPQNVKTGIIPEHLNEDKKAMKFLESYLEHYKDAGFIVFKIVF